MKRLIAVLTLVVLTFASTPASAQWGAMTGIHSIDISVSDSTVWIVGTDNTVYSLPKQNIGTGSFTPAVGDVKAVRIGVSQDNVVYIVSVDQGVYRYSGVGWLRLGSQTAIDVCANVNGPSIIGTDNKIYLWTGGEWKRFSDTYKGTRISDTNDGRIVIVGMDGSIFDSTGGNWGRLKDMKGQDIAVFGQTVWIVGQDNSIYYYQGVWSQYDGGQAQAISASQGTPYVIGRDNKPYVGQAGAR